MSLIHPYRKRQATGVLHLDGQPTVIYDTICTKSQRAWLATETMHCLLQEVWRNESNAWLIGRYVVMPDHIHYFAWATEAKFEYETWVKFWKSKFSKKHGQGQLRFQTGGWDRRMRCEAHYEEKWEYVRRNPVRAKLVDNMEDWPFQGTVHDFRW